MGSYKRPVSEISASDRVDSELAKLRWRDIAIRAWLLRAVNAPHVDPEEIAAKREALLEIQWRAWRLSGEGGRPPAPGFFAVRRLHEAPSRLAG